MRATVLATNRAERDRCSSRTAGQLAAVVLLVLVHWCTLGADTPEQPPANPVVPAEGLELWTALLHQMGLRMPADTANPLLEPQTHPSAWVIMHLGHDLRYLEGDDPRRTELFTVAQGGGAILLATDGELHLQELDLHCFPGPVLGPDTGQWRHRGRPTCFYVPPANSPIPLPFQAHPWNGRQRIACNVSGYLHKTRPWHPLAVFPPGCTLARQPLPPATTAFALLRLGPPSNDSRPLPLILAIADHSLFINQMLLEPGTQNWEFAIALAKMLQGQPARRWCRVYHNGQLLAALDTLQQLLSPPTLPPPAPLPPVLPDVTAIQQQLTELGNQALAKWQERDVWNAALLGPPLQRSTRWGTLLRLGLVVALGVVWWRWWQAVQRQRSAQPSPSAWRSSKRASRRQRSLRSKTEAAVWLAALQQSVRQFFAAAGLNTTSTERLPEILVSPIVATATADRWQRQLTTLWEFARQSNVSASPLTDWAQWSMVLEELETARSAGDWRFACGKLLAQRKG